MLPPQFELIDVVFAILIVIAAVRGAFRGFVAEVGSAASIILGIGGAVLFYRPGARLISGRFGQSMWNPLRALRTALTLLSVILS